MHLSAVLGILCHLNLYVVVSLKNVEHTGHPVQMRRQPNEAKTELAFADKRLRRIALRMKAWIRYGTIYIDVSVCCEFTLNENNKAGSVSMAEPSLTALLWNATNQGRKGESSIL